MIAVSGATAQQAIYLRDIKNISIHLPQFQEQEAIRVVKKMPKWKPGKQNGKKVRVQYNLPIKYTTLRVNFRAFTA